MIQFRKAGSDDCRAVTDVVQNTKAEIYPRYYPKEVVTFFADLHCYDHVMQDVVSGLVYVLEVEGRIVGTGSFQGNHITRVYILPDSQGMQALLRSQYEQYRYYQSSMEMIHIKYHVREGITGD